MASSCNVTFRFRLFFYVLCFIGFFVKVVNCTLGDMLDIVICAYFGVEKLRGLGYTERSNFGVSR